LNGPASPITRPLLVRLISFGAALLYGVVCPVRGQISFEKEPIHYHTAPVHDPIAELQQKMDSGEVKLDYNPKQEYLPALLEALAVPPSSQMLVFSKTSFQLQKINPRRPRALFFNDHVYLGWVQQGDLIEVASVDPELGPIFYTLDIQPSEQPRFVRDQGQCLVCHASSRTQGVPGLLVRSVFADRSGHPIIGSGTFTIDHTNPLNQRWGGWYVTGTHGPQRHMGNQVADQQARPVAIIDREAGANVTDLRSRLNTSPYLTPHSDLIALMVLEHQTQMQNYITRAAYEARSAMAYDQVMNKALERPADTMSDSTRRRIDAKVEKLVRYLLFTEEVRLTAPLAGTSAFATDFSRVGPRDSQGRSLRDFDLQTRLFKYPCSYLIYSASFDALPLEVQQRVYQHLWDILTSQETTSDFSHLSIEDRAAILKILRETKSRLPAYWTSAG
jgi:hypothetical protein